jgi:hypothetical protein
MKSVRECFLLVELNYLKQQPTTNYVENSIILNLDLTFNAMLFYPKTFSIISLILIPVKPILTMEFLLFFHNTLINILKANLSKHKLLILVPGTKNFNTLTSSKKSFKKVLKKMIELEQEL